MHLKTLRIQNFAGVRSAELCFDGTTVLIGENNCGKSSLLDALGLVLGSRSDDPPQFERRHFHQPGGNRRGTVDARAIPDAIRIDLIFDEQKIGAWCQPEMQPLTQLIPQRSGTLRQLLVRLEADPPTDPTSSVPARWIIGAVDGAGSSNDPELLALIRRLNPLIDLRGCPLSAAALGRRNGGDAWLANDPEGRKLQQRVDRHFHAVISGGSQDHDVDMEAGVVAAEELLEHMGVRLDPAAGLGQKAIGELVGRSARLAQTRPNRLPSTSIQRLGLLIFTAVILRGLPQGNGHPDWPILILEDLEAHLHRMTLAAVWRLVSGFDVQKIITTQSATLLAASSLTSLRRLTRHNGDVLEWRVHEDALSNSELRKLGYHLRARRGEAAFARAWILVEGETEFWVINELARIEGRDFDLEGIACVEFAQCGIPPLVKAARELGIEWHLLTDGDAAGRSYVERTRALFVDSDKEAERITRLTEPSLEQCFHDHGYATVFQRLAGFRGDPGPNVSSQQVIERSFKRHAKPDIALQLVMAAAEPGSPGVPEPLAAMIETVVQMARQAPERGNAARNGNAHQNSNTGQ
jgi:putative ATP-dependent endonuclease of the OLD family